MNRLHVIQAVTGVLLLCGSMTWAQTDTVLVEEKSDTAKAATVEVTPGASTVNSISVITPPKLSSGGGGMMGSGGMMGGGEMTGGVAGVSSGSNISIAPSRRAKALATAMQVSSGYGYGADAVLIIPSEDITDETIKAIREDMTIMNRIFQKRLRIGSGYGNVSLLYSDSPYGLLTGDIPIGDMIYLQGYGVLFKLRVKMSLLPPIQTEEKEVKEEVTDPLWAQTKQELQAKPDAGYYPRKPHTIWTRPVSMPQYDAEKVAELKQSLLKALLHASNIRSLQADEWITVVVVGDAVPTVTQKMVVSKSDGDDDKSEIFFVDPYIIDSQSTSGQTVLTVRVKKSDVNAAAQKEITPEEFEKRVKMFTYAVAGAVAATPPPPTSVSEEPASVAPSPSQR